MEWNLTNSNELIFNSEEIEINNADSDSNSEMF